MPRVDPRVTREESPASFRSGHLRRACDLDTPRVDMPTGAGGGGNKDQKSVVNKKAKSKNKSVDSDDEDAVCLAALKRSGRRPRGWMGRVVF